MASGNLAAGILGGISGGADVVQEQARDKRETNLGALAERLKLELQNEYNIKGEKRAIAREDEVYARQRGDVLADREATQGFEMEKLYQQQRNALEQIGASGESSLEQIRVRAEEARKTLGVKQGETPDADTMTQLVSQLQVGLVQAGLPVEVGLDGSITNTGGLTEEQQKLAEETAKAYGFAIAFGNERNEDQPGASLLWWADNKPVKDIVGTAYTGQKGILGGAASSQSGQQTPEASGSIVQELLSESGATTPSGGVTAPVGEPSAVYEGKDGNLYEDKGGQATRVARKPSEKQLAEIQRYEQLKQQEGIREWTAGSLWDAQGKRVATKPSGYDEYLKYQEALKRLQQRAG